MPDSKYIKPGTEKNDKNFGISMATLQWDFMHEVRKICEYYGADEETTFLQFSQALAHATSDFIRMKHKQ